MAKYNIAQIQKMVDRLAEIGINTEKAILSMEFEDLEKAIRKNKKDLFLFLGEEID